MPYITQEKRQKFNDDIISVIELCKEDMLNNFAVYIAKLSTNYLNKFNKNVSEKQTSKLEILIENISNNFDEDMYKAAGEFNYCVCAVYWAILGDSKDFPKADYGTRAYLNGLVDFILSLLSKDVKHTDATTILRGVFDHIKHETYRLKTVPYEDEKIFFNGTVWHEGKL